MYKTSVLPNGLRIVTIEMPVLRSVASTIFIKAGSRNESPELSGISHFLEHMVFKGTKKYPNQAAVAEAIEGVGGALNAWTSHDHTAYWNQVPKERVPTAVDVISDLISSPQIRPADLERERGVIIEEIHRYQDLPQRYVIDLIYTILFPGHPLGQFIIGTKENIRRFEPQDFLSYQDAWYRPHNMVFVFAGGVTHEQVVGEVKDRLGALAKKPTGGIAPASTKQDRPQALVHPKKTDQAHLVIAVRGVPYNHPDRFVLAVLNTALGEGMSSRLFMRIREEKGLAYSIHSDIEHFEDTGNFIIHAGLNLRKLEYAMEAIVGELKELKDKKVPAKELARVKEYMRGNISLSVDEPEEMAAWFGRQFLFEPEVLTPDQVIEKLMAISDEDLNRVAKTYFVPANLSLAVIAPVNKKKETSFATILEGI